VGKPKRRYRQRVGRVETGEAVNRTLAHESAFAPIDTESSQAATSADAERAPHNKSTNPAHLRIALISTRSYTASVLVFVIGGRRLWLCVLGAQRRTGHHIEQRHEENEDEKVDQKDDGVLVECLLHRFGDGLLS
jgi:hypothetical protein